MLAAIVTMSVAISPDLQATTAADGTMFVRQAIETPVTEAKAPKATSRILYINRNGGVVMPGANDSRAGTSSIVKQPVSLAGWTTTTAKWNATMDCLREIWAPFAVTVTDVDPGTVQHLEAMVGDVPDTLGLPVTVGGVSPMSLTCSVIENSIVYAFPAKLHDDPRRVCEVISQELGHSYGLDHELDAKDPMTYLSYSGKRAFQDAMVSCGEDSPRPCGLEGHTCRPQQNSHALLLERLGAAGADETPPAAEITAPLDGERVEPGFVVVANATDDVAVAEVTLLVDDEPVATKLEGPYEFTTDAALAAGSHRIAIEVVDPAGNATTHAVIVRIAGDDGDDDGGDDEQAAMASCSTASTPGSALIALALLVLLRRRRRAQLFARLNTNITTSSS